MKARFSFPLVGCLTLLGACLPVSGFCQVVVNEVVSSNVESLLTHRGETPDWVEIKNEGPVALNLSGWGLSDDPLEPYKFTFPSVVVPAGGFQLVFASDEEQRLFANEWTTIVDLGDEWSYFDGVQEPDSDWADPTYDDSDWLTGPSGFGYSDGDDQTVTIGNSVYLRRAFDIDASLFEEITALYLHVDRDDGFVAYLNGVEILRGNLGYPGDPTTFDQKADQMTEARIYQGLQAEGQLVDPEGLLVAGHNVLAIQVHTARETKAARDLTAIGFLSYGRVTETGGGDFSPFIAIEEAELHAAFKLSASGESVVLTDASGVTQDEFSTGQMYVDDSFGRAAGTGELVYFATPTPGAENTTEGRPGYSVAPELSPLPGLFTSPVTVSVIGDPGSGSYYYTLNASEPSEASSVYSGSFSVTDNVNLVRVRLIEEGLWPSPIVSASYLKSFSTEGAAVLSIVMDPEDLFDEETGLYVDGPDASPDWPYYGANFWQDWERPAHVDLLEPDGSPGFSIDAGIKVHGGTSRASDQRSLRLQIRGGYGESELSYPLFESTEVSTFDRLIFRNSGQDWLETHLRDAWAHQAFQELGALGQAYRPAVAFLNGQYWGIYNIREFQNATYIKEHTGFDEVDLIRRKAGVQAGDLEEWNELLRFLEQTDLSVQENFDRASEMIDVQNHTNWFILNVYLSNTDWPQNNIRRWRPRTPDGRWKWLLWDLDFGMGWAHPPDFRALERALEGLGIPGYSREVAVSLLENSDYEAHFINSYLDLLSTQFRTDRLLPLFSETLTDIEPLISDHQNRWGSSYENWLEEVESMKVWIERRPDEARDNLAEYFGYGETWNFDLDIEPIGTGLIDLAATTIDEDLDGDYFVGLPITLTARPKPGFAFVGWEARSGAVLESPTIVLAPQDDFELIARFEEGPPPPNLVVHEFNYNSASDIDPGDWIELFNAGEEAVSLAGWSIKDEKDSNVYELPDLELPPGFFIVLAENLADFSAVFPDVSFVTGELGFKLGNGGDSVRLFDAAGSLHVQVDFDDESPWPTEPDGNGPTLELIRSDLEPGDPQSWAPSVASHGTPGTANSVSP